jgi:hypothetical protein
MLGMVLVFVTGGFVQEDDNRSHACVCLKPSLCVIQWHTSQSARARERGGVHFSLTVAALTPPFYTYVCHPTHTGYNFVRAASNVVCDGSATFLSPFIGRDSISRPV